MTKTECNIVKVYRQDRASFLCLLKLLHTDLGSSYAEKDGFDMVSEQDPVSVLRLLKPSDLGPRYAEKDSA